MEAISLNEEWQSVGRMLRDPSYLFGLAVLVGVIALSVAVGGSSSSASPPEPQALATPAPTSVPEPTAVPSPTLGQVLLDSRRALDLTADGAALEAYRVRYGVYPSSEGLFSTFCNFAYDPGCQVVFVTRKISGGDGTNPYWYRSDGKTYSLFAQISTPHADNHCPPELPPSLVALPVLCVSAPGGTP